MKVLSPYIRIFLLLLITVALSASSYAQKKVVDPVVKVINRSDKNVNLAWQAFTGDVSQYVLERSTDARKFYEISVFVAMFGDEEPSYEFNDRFKASYAGPLYYRLRVEGLDGSVVFTPVTTIRAMQNK
jgi:hypothetical protein